MTQRMKDEPSAIATPLAACLACSTVAALAVILDLLIAPEGASLTREGGPIELCSAWFYIVALAVFWVRSTISGAWPGLVLLVAMFLRELDADKRFTAEGILSTKVFVYDTVMWEKLLAALVLGLLLASLAMLAWRGVPRLVRALAARRVWAIYFVASLVLLVVSKSIDGLGRKLAAFGISVPDAIDTRAGQIEEVMELGIPVLLLMAILARRSARTE